jgi:hypothetical protein
MFSRKVDEIRIGRHNDEVIHPCKLPNLLIRGGARKTCFEDVLGAGSLPACAAYA